MNTGTPAQPFWFGYIFRGGPTTKKGYKKGTLGVTNSVVYSIKEAEEEEGATGSICFGFKAGSEGQAGVKRNDGTTEAGGEKDKSGKPGEKVESEGNKPAEPTA